MIERTSDSNSYIVLLTTHLFLSHYIRLFMTRVFLLGQSYFSLLFHMLLSLIKSAFRHIFNEIPQVPSLLKWIGMNSIDRSLFQTALHHLHHQHIHRPKKNCIWIGLAGLKWFSERNSNEKGNWTAVDDSLYH